MAAPILGKLFHPQSGNIRIERRAWACLESCRKKAGVGRLALPIPVDEWIETGFGIRFGVADLSRLGPGVLGASFIQDREIVVAESALRHEGRFRFTCAHELGHFILHAKLADAFHDKELPVPESAGRLERQADRFAAAFLMPLPLLEQELLDVCRKRALDAEYCIAELMMPTEAAEWLWRMIFLPELTRRFAVSQAAAVLRCAYVRLDDPDGRPMLPARLREALLGPAADEQFMKSMRIVQGRPCAAVGAARFSTSTG